MSHASVLVALTDGNIDLQSAVAWHMAPFQEEGAWFENGTRWDWWVIGGRYKGRLNASNTLLVRDLAPNKFQAKRLKEAEEQWADMKKEPKDLWKMLFDCSPDMTLDGLLLQAKRAWFPAHYAFLSAGKWHERERLGFFGCSAPTECHRDGQSKTVRCKAKAKGAADAYIVTWHDDWDTWDLKFYDRFIKPLNPDTRLVTVDYHI